MGIGAQSSVWRKALFRSLDRFYIRRSCVTEDGAFDAYVSAGSSLKVLNPRGLSLDPVHQRFIREWVNERSTVWDIGTNLGLFALPAALRATRGVVYGFEPDVEIVVNVLRSLRLPRNAGLKVTLFCMGISDTDGTARFQISKFSRAMSKLEGVGHWHDAQVQTAELRYIPTLRIDTLAKSIVAPTVIKIDVEGAEMRVLEGGKETISRWRPTMLIEGPRELWQPMGDFLRRYDYIMLDGAADDKTPLNHPVWDTVAVPKERFST
jgi:FkbM family methyltransferase